MKLSRLPYEGILIESYPGFHGKVFRKEAINASMGRCSERYHGFHGLPCEGVHKGSYHGFHGKVFREEVITASMGSCSERKLSRLSWSSMEWCSERKL